MMYLRNIINLEDYKTLLSVPDKVYELRNNILNGDLYIVKNAINKDFILKVRKYLTGIGRGSLPNYQAITPGAPNFHRINIWDDRAYVKGCFHQFTFFPWNQDIFQLFEATREVYYLKNLVNNQPKEKFLGQEPQDGCIARLSFQFYPKGVGGLNKHSDPVDHHQLTVPLLIMSKKGKDFKTGGVYVENEAGEHIFTDDICDIGDVVLFNAQVPHGVKIIDEESQEDWLSFEGRWMMIFATNKLFDNQEISDAIDLESNAS